MRSHCYHFLSSKCIFYHRSFHTTLQTHGDALHFVSIVRLYERVNDRDCFESNSKVEPYSFPCSRKALLVIFENLYGSLDDALCFCSLTNTTKDRTHLCFFGVDSFFFETIYEPSVCKGVPIEHQSDSVPFFSQWGNLLSFFNLYYNNG